MMRSDGDGFMSAPETYARFAKFYDVYTARYTDDIPPPERNGEYIVLAEITD